MQRETQTATTVPLMDDDTLAFGEEDDIAAGKLKHPFVTFFHLLFRTLALLVYLFCTWFSNSFIASFVTILLLLSMDFWTVKNITGRLMVGLRWWNYVDDNGESHWVYESRKVRKSMPTIMEHDRLPKYHMTRKQCLASEKLIQLFVAFPPTTQLAPSENLSGSESEIARHSSLSIRYMEVSLFFFTLWQKKYPWLSEAPLQGTQQSRINPAESRIFWTALIVCPALWVVFFFVALFGFKFKWLMVVTIALILNGANLHGYVKCRLGHGQKLTTTISTAASNFFRQQVIDNIMSLARQNQSARTTSQPNVI